LILSKRKICVVVASRANYGRVKYLMKAIRESELLELQLIVGASALLYKFGRVIDVIRQDGFEPNYQIHYLVEGENLTTQAKSTGMGIIELSTAFEILKPDVVVTVADRFETMATAIAASYLNIPLAHVQGGEVSGNIDDSVRHAITKLAHLHYPSTEKSAERIIKMGEEPSRVHWSGCPAMDVLANIELSLPSRQFFEIRGTGQIFDPEQPYMVPNKSWKP
jgi:GDP/UDP-N,N'-diacetylbacillosamine 2-epimerase (hydrolysing)